MLSYEPVGLIARSTKGSGEAKVCQFEDTGLGDEDIGSFQVPVEDVVRVNIVKTIQELLHDLIHSKTNRLKI